MSARRQAQQSLYTPQLQQAGKRVGPFSAATQCWSGAAGSGFSLVAGTFVGMRFYRAAGSTNNQTLYAFNNGSTDGQRIILSNARTCSFFNGANNAVMPGPPNYLGLQHMLVGNIGGTLWVSQNGSVGTSFAIPGGAIIPGSGTAIQAYGADKSSASFACTQTSLLQNYVITGAAFTPSQMAAITGDKNALDRWHAGDLVKNAVGLQWFLNWEDWDGVSATFAGTGPGAITLTRGGGGGGQTVMPAQDRYRIPVKAKESNATYLFIPQGSSINPQTGSYLADTFSVTQITTDSADTTNGPAGLIVDCYGRNLSIVGNANAGVNIAGTNVAGNNIGGAEMSVFDIIESIDVPGMGAGSKLVKVTESIQSIIIATGEIEPNASPQFLRVTHGASVAFTDAYGTVYTKAQRFISDSLLEEELGLTDVPGVKGPAYDSSVPLQRAAHPTDLVSSVCLGGDTWFNNISSQAAIDADVSRALRGLRGTVTNWLRVQRGRNDSFFNTYVSQATFKTNLLSWLTSLKAAVAALGIPGFKCQLIGSTAYNGVGGSPTQYPGSTANPSGFFLADFSATQSSAIATFADANYTFVDFVTVVTSDVAHKPDGTHYAASGHVQWSAGADANTPP